MVRQLYKEGGLKSVFRGTGATLARDGPGSAAYFGAYEAIKRSLTPKDADAKDLNLMTVLTAGGLAGMAMWSVALPMDVVKSRYQGAPQGTYSGFLQCFRHTLATDGAKGLFKGAGPALLRAFPANAATFVSTTYSLFQKAYLPPSSVLKLVSRRWTNFSNVYRDTRSCVLIYMLRPLFNCISYCIIMK